MAYHAKVVQAATLLVERIMGYSDEDPERPIETTLEDLSRDDVYSLKWVYEQAIAFVENDFENRPED